MQNEELSFLLRQGVGSDPQSTPQCPGDDEIAAFIDDALGLEESQGIREHLAGCDSCLARVGFVARLQGGRAPEVPSDLLARVRALPDEPRIKPLRPRWRLPAAAAAAALVVVALMVGRWGEFESARDAPSDVRGLQLLQPPEILSPREGAVIPPGQLGELELRWTPVPGAIYYDVRLVTADGVRVWDGRVDGESHRLPGHIQVAPAEELFVWVRAYLAGGKTLQSEIVGFQLAGGGTPRD